jgi:NADH-quinone oxidoreductase subunit N
MLSALFAQAAPFKGPSVDWYGLSPVIILVAGGILLLVTSALFPRLFPRGAYAIGTALVAAAAGTMAAVLWNDTRRNGTRLVASAYSLDGFSLFLTVVICAAVVLTALFMDDYLRREGLDGMEIYALLLMSAVGGVVMASANDLIVLFLGLETLSIALYVLAASHLRNIASQESSIKYFVLGGFSSAFFLYGIAMIYGATGATNLTKIAAFLEEHTLISGSNGMLLAGFALLLVGLGFKVAAAPFHMWTPDVYQGAPTPVTGFMASAAKTAGFAALLRVFVVTFGSYVGDWQPVVTTLTVLTLVVGAVLAVVQTDVKRMLAYSSISHAGFILLGVQSAADGEVGRRGISGSLFYLAAYAVMVLGTFGVIMLVTGTGDSDHSLDRFQGLGKRQPVLALVLTLFLLAQAGVPFTSGFWAKAGVLGAAIDAHRYGVAVVAMLSAAIAAFLYLRIVKTMYFDEPAEGAGRARVPFGAGAALTFAVAFTLFVGFLPNVVLDLARHAVPLALRK